MTQELSVKISEVENDKNELEELKRMIIQKEVDLKKRVEELEYLRSSRSIEDLLEATNAKYVHLGEILNVEKKEHEDFGLIVIEHVAFLVWKYYAASNQGTIHLRVDGFTKKIKAICLCGCGLNYEDSGKFAYMLDDIKEEAEICKGFLAKPIISKCVEISEELGVSLIFARNGYNVGRIGDVKFREIRDFEEFIPYIGKKLLKDVSVNGDTPILIH